MTDQSKTTDEGITDGAPPESAGEGGTQDTGSRDAETVDWQARAEQLQAREEAWKRQVEEAKQVKARLAELESASSPAVRGLEDEEAELLRINQELARQGDAAAKLALREREARIHDKRQAAIDRELDRLPEAEAEEVKAHILANPGRFGDVRTARNDLRATKQDDEMRRLREERDKLKELLSRGPDPEVTKAPPTQGREYSARETKARDMTYEQYDAQIAELRAAGKIKDAFQLQRELNDGKVRLRN